MWIPCSDGMKNWNQNQYFFTPNHRSRWPGLFEMLFTCVKNFTLCTRDVTFTSIFYFFLRIYAGNLEIFESLNLYGKIHKLNLWQDEIIWKENFIHFNFSRHSLFYLLIMHLVRWFSCGYHFSRLLTCDFFFIFFLWIAIPIWNLFISSVLNDEKKRIYFVQWTYSSSACFIRIYLNCSFSNVNSIWKSLLFSFILFNCRKSYFVSVLRKLTIYFLWLQRWFVRVNRKAHQWLHQSRRYVRRFVVLSFLHSPCRYLHLCCSENYNLVK